MPEPRDSDASPYVTAIADIGSDSVTGQVYGVAPEAVEVEQPVSLGVEPADDQRVIVFNPP